MAETTTTTTTLTPEQQLQQALVDRATNSVSSVSVDGMSTSYATLDPATALTSLQRQKASKNPLSAIKIFKVK